MSNLNTDLLTQTCWDNALKEAREKTKRETSNLDLMLFAADNRIVDLQRQLDEANDKPEGTKMSVYVTDGEIAAQVIDMIMSLPDGKGVTVVVGGDKEQ